MSEEQAVSKEPAPALPELKINLASDGKAEIRTKVWDYLSDNKLTTFPWPPHKRNPNFKGSEEAGDKAIKTDVFGKAKVIKVDADKPLQEVRIKAMEEHKSVLVPTPRLRYGFLNKIVPPEDADKKMFKICATRQGLEEYSQPVGIDDKLHVDIVAVGAVAVSPKGWKIGKGEGYSDLEYAVMAALGMVDSSTSVVAVVHDSQVLDLPDKVFSKHDVPVDYIITPTRVIKCDGRPARPAGIIWSLLDADKLGSTPILRKLRYRDWKAGKDVKLSGETEAPADLEDEELKMEDDAEKRPRQRRPFRRGFGRRRGRGGNRGGDGDRDVSKSDGDGDAKVNGSGGGRRRGGYRSFRGGWGRRGRGGRRGGSRGDGGRQREDSENDGGHSGDERSSPRRGGGYRRRGGFRPRRGFDDCEGSVYVGSLPRSLRVSDFKGEVRDRKVNPLRVMWRGSSGFAFLNFKTHQEAEEALVALEGLTFEDRAPRLEMAKERERNRGSRRRGQRADSHSGGEDDEGED